MNILLDFVTLSVPTGAGEYLRRVYKTLFKDFSSQVRSNRFFALVERNGVFYEDLKDDFLFDNDISTIKINSESDLSEIIIENQIDRFFIGCAQYIGRINGVQNISCQTICVVHDLSYEENYYNHIQPFQALNHKLFRQDFINERLGRILLLKWKSPTMRFCRWYFSMRSNGLWEKDLIWMDRIMQQFKCRDDNMLIAVSEYTKNSIIYNFGIDSNRIKVFYSPERCFESNTKIENQIVNKLITNQTSFYLLVSAGRLKKNAYKALKAFEKYSSIKPGHVILTIGYGESLFDNHYDVDFLSDSDLSACYQGCYALLYPSFFEGFGYPPIEAMRFSKPVLSSNVCSMPEILSSSAIYFSPLYESDIFRALNLLDSNNYNIYTKLSNERYKIISKRQTYDLKSLIKMIIG